MDPLPPSELALVTAFFFRCRLWTTLHSPGGCPAASPPDACAASGGALASSPTLTLLSVAVAVDGWPCAEAPSEDEVSLRLLPATPPVPLPAPLPAPLVGHASKTVLPLGGGDGKGASEGTASVATALRSAAPLPVPSSSEPSLTSSTSPTS
jgi:hypothetical protein